jgi:hypothetical protein
VVEEPEADAAGAETGGTQVPGNGKMPQTQSSPASR